MHMHCQGNSCPVEEIQSNLFRRKRLPLLSFTKLETKCLQVKSVYLEAPGYLELPAYRTNFRFTRLQNSRIFCEHERR